MAYVIEAVDRAQGPSLVTLVCPDAERISGGDETALAELLRRSGLRVGLLVTRHETAVLRQSDWTSEGRVYSRLETLPTHVLFEKVHLGEPEAPRWVWQTHAWLRAIQYDWPKNLAAEATSSMVPDVIGNLVQTEIEVAELAA